MQFIDINIMLTCAHQTTWCRNIIVLCALCCVAFKLWRVSQDALTDLTGDSERLPVEEQHGTWLGHKVRHYRFKPLTYSTYTPL